MKKEIKSISDIWIEPNIDYVQHVKEFKKKKQLKRLYILIACLSVFGLSVLLYFLSSY